MFYEDESFYVLPNFVYQKYGGKSEFNCMNSLVRGRKFGAHGKKVWLMKAGNLSSLGIGMLVA